jgi:hypothetical protein
MVLCETKGEMARKTNFERVTIAHAKAESLKSRTGNTVNMPKRNLRVVKWLSATPAIGVCTVCSKEFKVPMTSLSKTMDAQAYLQEQFDRHKCLREED